MNDVVTARPVLDGARVERDAGFAGYVRTGATIETKAFTGVTGAEGGYAVPKEIDAQIDAVLKAAKIGRAHV